MLYMEYRQLCYIINNIYKISFHSGLCVNQFADSQHQLEVYICDIINNKKQLSKCLYTLVYKQFIIKTMFTKFCI